MRERKYVKLRVDMHEDTKFKIIDTMEDRDLIHYIWIRLLTLAGKVNLEGDLYMSKNIPHTAETLSIEFNRSIEKVQLALNVLKDLEMLEVTENEVYRVRNFAKHQNIKVKEILRDVPNREYINNKEDIIKNLVNNNFEIEENRKNENLETKPYKEKSQELKEFTENKVQNNIEDNKISNSSKTSDEKSITDKNTSKKEGKVINLNNDKNQKISNDNKNVQVKECDFKEKLNNDSNFNSQVVLDKKKVQKSLRKNNRKRGNNDINQIDEDNIVEVFDGIDIPEREGGRVVKSFEF